MTNRNDIEQLFKTHYAQLCRLATALLHDDELARDIVHDVFTSLLDGHTSLHASGGYLLYAVRNRCLLEHRTDGTDAFDTLYIGCEKFPFHNSFSLATSGVV